MWNLGSLVVIQILESTFTFKLLHHTKFSYLSNFELLFDKRKKIQGDQKLLAKHLNGELVPSVWSIDFVV
jgi:hypothetical protein